MSKPVLLSGGNGKVQELAGTTNNDVLTWDSTLDGGSWKSAPSSAGSGTVTSVGLTGGTSGIVIGGTTSPITTSGTYDLDAPLRFAFNTTTPTEVAAAGQVSWNTDEGSLDLMFEGGHVKSVLGQTLHQRVLNDTGSTLTKGQVVYVSGAQGNRVTVSLAQADADSTSATIIGVIAYAIADGDEGYVITEGVIKGVVTTGFTEGAPVYLSPTTPGAFTQTKPEAPQHLVLLGYCVRADATTGEILIKTQNGYELGELHDVYINNPTSGQILIYDATTGQTRWENASLTGGTGVTVTPGPGSLSVAIGQSVATGASPTFAGLTLTGFSGLVRATAGVLAGSATVALGSEVSGTLPVANGGTNNGSLSVTQGTVYYGDGSKLVGLAPGTSGQFLQTQGAGANPQWASAATTTPYDFSSRFLGTPATSTILAEFVVDRTVVLGTTLGTAGSVNGWFFSCVTRPTTNNTDLLVKVNGSTTIATLRFTNASASSNGRFVATLVGSITATTLNPGDFLTVETSTTVDSAFATPIFSVLGTAT